MRIEKIPALEWKVLSEKAHLVVFNEKNSADTDRLDYALICVEGDKLLGYLTARETDHETVHWQFGGAFPGTRGTYTTFQGYAMFVSWTKERYKCITTFIENTNQVMLKFAMKIGFLIRGVRNANGKVLLDLCLEFK